MTHQMERAVLCYPDQLLSVSTVVSVRQDPELKSMCGNRGVYGEYHNKHNRSTFPGSAVIRHVGKNAFVDMSFLGNSYRRLGFL